MTYLPEQCEPSVAAHLQTKRPQNWRESGSFLATWRSSHKRDLQLERRCISFIPKRSKQSMRSQNSLHTVSSQPTRNVIDVRAQLARRLTTGFSLRKCIILFTIVSRGQAGYDPATIDRHSTFTDLFRKEKGIGHTMALKSESSHMRSPKHTMSLD